MLHAQARIYVCNNCLTFVSMKLFRFAPVLMLLLQCSPQQPVKPDQTHQTGTPALSDTLPVATTPADTKGYAIQLLEEKTRVSDDGPVNACLDSLKSANPAVRNFYWKVLRVILRDSDGALSETLGSRLIDLLQRNPQEFVAQYEICDMTIRAKCTSFMGYENFMEEVPEQAIDEKFGKLKSGCKNCSADQTEILDDICQEIKKAVRWYRKNE